VAPIARGELRFWAVGVYVRRGTFAASAASLPPPTAFFRDAARIAQIVSTGPASRTRSQGEHDMGPSVSGEHVVGLSALLRFFGHEVAGVWLNSPEKHPEKPDAISVRLPCTTERQAGDPKTLPRNP